MSAGDCFKVKSGEKIVPVPQFISVKSEDGLGEYYLPGATFPHYQKLCKHLLVKNRNCKSLSFDCASSLLPKSTAPSEDSHFLSLHFLGVSDGVGGWRQFNIDSGVFSSELMSACRCHEPLLWHSHVSNEPARNALRAIARTAISEVKSYGGATLMLVGLVEDRLSILNLGDSQAMVVRFEGDSAKCIVKTKAMQHKFNTPFQVSRPLKWAGEGKRRAAMVICDSPESADCYEIRVKPGDLLVVGSDGLWDNLFEQEVLSQLHPGLPASLLAKRLTLSAYQKSLQNLPTPFQLDATLAYGCHAWSGGKRDDITAIVAWIHSDPFL